MRRILNDADAGMMFGYNESGEEFFRRLSTFKTDFNFIKKFERKSISEKFAELINSIASKTYGHKK